MEDNDSQQQEEHSGGKFCSAEFLPAGREPKAESEAETTGGSGRSLEERSRASGMLGSGAAPASAFGVGALHVTAERGQQLTVGFPASNQWGLPATEHILLLEQNKW